MTGKIENEYVVGLLHHISITYDININDLLELHSQSFDKRNKQIKYLQKNKMLEFIILDKKEYLIDEDMNIYNYDNKKFVGIYDIDNESIKFA